jgi:hypothetical protein
MSRLAITAVLALGIGIAVPMAGHAAAVPTPVGAKPAAASIDTVQFAQFVDKKPGARGGPGPGRVGGPGPGAGRFGGPGPGAGRFGGPGPGAGRFGGPGPGRVGGPGPGPGRFVGRPVGVVGPRGGVGPGRVYGPGRVVGGPRFVYGYRPWYRRPHFGTIIGGVALGTILTVAAVGAAPAVAPAPGLCWYWADEYQSQGYWDYC